MKLRNQRTLKILKAQIPECAEEDKDKNYACQPYHAPEVFLVGKAKRLVAGLSIGNNRDAGGHYYQFF